MNRETKPLLARVVYVLWFYFKLLKQAANQVHIICIPNTCRFSCVLLNKRQSQNLTLQIKINFHI